jgi:hypothetical protein
MTGWRFEHAVHVKASVESAWAFWTDVASWTLDTSLEWVNLDGPFAAGTRGTTKPRGSAPLQWLIQHAAPGEAIIDMELPGAVVRFEWRFVRVEPEVTSISQTVTLSGPKAEE